MLNFNFIHNGDSICIKDNNSEINLDLNDYQDFIRQLKIIVESNKTKPDYIYNNRIWCISSREVNITPQIDDHFKFLINDLRRIKKNSIFLKQIFQIHNLDNVNYVEFYCENSQMPILGIIHQLEYLKTYLNCHGYNITGILELYPRPTIMSDKLAEIHITEDKCNLLYDIEQYSRYIHLKKVLKNSNDLLRKVKTTKKDTVLPKEITSIDNNTTMQMMMQ